MSQRLDNLQADVAEIFKTLDSIERLFGEIALEKLSEFAFNEQVSECQMPDDINLNLCKLLLTGMNISIKDDIVFFGVMNLHMIKTMNGNT